MPTIFSTESDLEAGLFRMTIGGGAGSGGGVEEIISTFWPFRLHKWLAGCAGLVWATLAVLVISAVMATCVQVESQGTPFLAMVLLHAGVIPAVVMMISTVQATVVDADGALAVLRAAGQFPLTPQALTSLRRWRFGYRAMGALWTGLNLAAAASTLSYWAAAAPSATISACVISLVLIVAYWAVFAPWIFSLQIAAVLAAAPVDAVIKAVEDPESSGDMTEQQWQELVCMPVRSLCTETLPRLSDWGPSVAVAIVAAVLAGLGVVIESMAVGWAVGYIVAVFDALLIPVAIGLIPAAVSTRCVALQQGLNMVRFANLGSEATDSATLQRTKSSVEVTHTRVSAVEHYITNQNKGGGLGFVMFGSVVTTDHLVKIAAIVGTSASSLVAGLHLIVHHLDAYSKTTETRQIVQNLLDCALSVEQQQIINVALVLANVSVQSSSVCALVAEASGVAGLSNSPEG